jgi:hypothetical protein
VSSFQAHRQARIGDGRAFAAAWRAGPAIGPDRAGSATRVEAIVTALASRRRRCEPHLNRVLGKTGVLCQTELAALLAGAALELYRSQTHYRRPLSVWGGKYNQYTWIRVAYPHLGGALQVDNGI